MNLRNLEGVSRTSLSPRNAPLSVRGERGQRPGVLSNPASPLQGASRGAFFDMMVATQQASPAPARTSPATAARVLLSSGDRRPNVQTSGVRILSSDESSAVRGGSRTVTKVRNAAAAASQDATTAPSTNPSTGQGEVPPVPAQTPVEAINGLLTKLGFDPANFNARVTSSTISVPGLSYEYPLLEVTVNGERVGFHLPSAMKDPRMTAANISSMMGRPVMDLAVFA